MNERLKELYKSCRPKEALASQEQYNSADILIGTEVAKFAELIIRECFIVIKDSGEFAEFEVDFIDREFKEHFGVDV